MTEIGRAESEKDRLREQLRSRLIVALGGLTLAAVGVLSAIEGEPVKGGGLAIAGGLLGGVAAKLARADFRASRR